GRARRGLQLVFLGFLGFLVAAHLTLGHRPTPLLDAAFDQNSRRLPRESRADGGEKAMRARLLFLKYAQRVDLQFLCATALDFWLSSLEDVVAMVAQKLRMRPHFGALRQSQSPIRVEHTTNRVRHAAS